MRDYVAKRKSAGAVPPTPPNNAMEQESARYVPDFSKRRKSSNPSKTKGTSSPSANSSALFCKPQRNVDDNMFSASEVDKFGEQNRFSEEKSDKDNKGDFPSEVANRAHSRSTLKVTKNKEIITRASRKRKLEESAAKVDDELLENLNSPRKISFSAFIHINNIKNSAPIKDENYITATSPTSDLKDSTVIKNNRNSSSCRKEKRRKARNERSSTAKEALDKLKFVSREERTAECEGGSLVREDTKSTESINSDHEVTQATCTYLEGRQEKYFSKTVESDSVIPMTTDGNAEEFVDVLSIRTAGSHNTNADDRMSKDVQAADVYLEMERLKKYSQSETVEIGSTSPKKTNINELSADEINVETVFGHPTYECKALINISSSVLSQRNQYFYSCTLTPEEVESAHCIHLNQEFPEEEERVTNGSQCSKAAHESKQEERFTLPAKDAECKLNCTSELKQNLQQSIAERENTNSNALQKGYDVLPEADSVCLNNTVVITGNAQVCVYESAGIPNDNEISLLTTSKEQDNSCVHIKNFSKPEKENEDIKKHEQDLQENETILTYESENSTRKLPECCETETKVESMNMQCEEIANSKLEQDDTIVAENKILHSQPRKESTEELLSNSEYDELQNLLMQEKATVNMDDFELKESYSVTRSEEYDILNSHIKTSKCDLLEMGESDFSCLGEKYRSHLYNWSLGLGPTEVDELNKSTEAFEKLREFHNQQNITEIITHSGLNELSKSPNHDIVNLGTKLSKPEVLEGSDADVSPPCEKDIKHVWPVEFCGTEKGDEPSEVIGSPNHGFSNSDLKASKPDIPDRNDALISSPSEKNKKYNWHLKFHSIQNGDKSKQSAEKIDGHRNLRAQLGESRTSLGMNKAVGKVVSPERISNNFEKALQSDVLEIMNVDLSSCEEHQKHSWSTELSNTQKAEESILIDCKTYNVHKKSPISSSDISELPNSVVVNTEFDNYQKTVTLVDIKNALQKTSSYADREETHSVRLDDTCYEQSNCNKKDQDVSFEPLEIHCPFHDGEMRGITRYADREETHSVSLDDTCYEQSNCNKKDQDVSFEPLEIHCPFHDGENERNNSNGHCFVTKTISRCEMGKENELSSDNALSKLIQCVTGAAENNANNASLNKSHELKSFATELIQETSNLRCLQEMEQSETKCLDNEQRNTHTHIFIQRDWFSQDRETQNSLQQEGESVKVVLSSESETSGNLEPTLQVKPNLSQISHEVAKCDNFKNALDKKNSGTNLNDVLGFCQFVESGAQSTVVCPSQCYRIESSETCFSNSPHGLGNSVIYRDENKSNSTHPPFHTNELCTPQKPMGTLNEQQIADKAFPELYIYTTADKEEGCGAAKLTKIIDCDFKLTTDESYWQRKVKKLNSSPPSNVDPLQLVPEETANVKISVICGRTDDTFEHRHGCNARETLLSEWQMLQCGIMYGPDNGKYPSLVNSEGQLYSNFEEASDDLATKDQINTTLPSASDNSEQYCERVEAPISAKHEMETSKEQNQMLSGVNDSVSASDLRQLCKDNDPVYVDPSISGGNPQTQTFEEPRTLLPGTEINTLKHIDLTHSDHTPSTSTIENDKMSIKKVNLTHSEHTPSTNIIENDKTSIKKVIPDYPESTAMSKDSSTCTSYEEAFDDDFELTASQLSQLDADVLKETVSSTSSVPNHADAEEAFSFSSKDFENSSIALEILSRLRSIQEKVTRLEEEMQILQQQTLTAHNVKNNHQSRHSLGRY